MLGEGLQEEGDAPVKEMLAGREVVETLFSLIPHIAAFHCRTDPLYQFVDRVIRDYFSKFEGDVLDVEPFRGLVWPHISLGNLSSYSFFSMDEGLLHYFYWHRRNDYDVAFDVGSNIGIDAILMSRFGYEVHAFEPDRKSFDVLVENARINGCENLHAYPKGISDSAGTEEFVRVGGNITASHVKGAREYFGDIEEQTVEMMTFDEVGVMPDLVKINVEGYEKVVVPSLPDSVWDNADVFIEIHNEENRSVVHEHLAKMDVNVFAQKLGWARADSIEELPVSNREGYIFASRKERMPW